MSFQLQRPIRETNSWFKIAWNSCINMNIPDCFQGVPDWSNLMASLKVIWLPKTSFGMWPILFMFQLWPKESWRRFNGRSRENPKKDKQSNFNSCCFCFVSFMVSVIALLNLLQWQQAKGKGKLQMTGSDSLLKKGRMFWRMVCWGLVKYFHLWSICRPRS